MSKVLGIDLGTTNSVVAVFENGEPRILSNASGNRTTPSVVAFPPDGGCLVGEPARNQQVTNPENTVYSIKRFMGRRHQEVLSEEKIVPYAVVGKPHEYVKVKIGRRQFTPQEMAGLLLRDLKLVAQRYLQEGVSRAVITVPAYFNDAQRQATKDAGEIAGLKVERIINEPTAAALAYGLEKRENKCIVVFDFGGGTFDLSVLKVGGGTFEVLATHGDCRLGGDDFDQRIIDVVADEYRRKEGVDLRTDSMALQRLKDAAEKAKIELSSRTETNIMLPFISVDGSGPKHLHHQMTRETFEGVCTDLFDQLRNACRDLLSEAGLTSNDVSEVVMVGGSTRIPCVQKIAKQVFATDELDRSINPDEVVAAGAAILGGVLSGEVDNVKLADVISHGLGVESEGGQMVSLLAKNSPIPTTMTRMFSTPRDNQTMVPIHVLEGEGSEADSNRTLANFQLLGIPRAPRGKPQIEVVFTIDADAILHVKATDKWTGKSQEIAIKGAVGFDKAEIERMKKATDEVGDDTEAQKSKADLRDHAERVSHDIHKWIEFNGTMMPPKARKQIEVALKKLDKRIEAKDFYGIRSALKKLEELTKPLRLSA